MAKVGVKGLNHVLRAEADSVLGDKRCRIIAIVVQYKAARYVTVM